MSIVFKPTSVTNLYANENALGWIAYLLPIEVTDKYTSITLENSLNKYKGIYLFASKKPDIQDSNFVNSIWSFLNNNSSGKNQRCFLWLNLDSNTSELGFGQIIVFNDDTSYLATAKALFGEKNSQHLLVNKSIFMAISPYCEVSVANDTILIARKPTSIASKYRYGMYLNNIETNKFIRLGNIDTRGVNIETPITIPMNGNNSGTLQFDVSFPFTFSDSNLRYFLYENDKYPYTYSGSEEEEFTILETGVKYYFLDAEAKQDTEMMYFLFNQKSDVGFKGSLDFADIFNKVNHRRTYFAFTGKNIKNQIETGETIIPSLFQTNFGKTINIAPIVNFESDGSPNPDSALLVLSDAVKLVSSKNKRYYWTPQGDFVLKSVGNTKVTDKSDMLLCGISGTETINFNTENKKYAGDRISFSSKNPAYCENFLHLEDPKNISNTPELLTNKYQTAWANIIKSPTTNNIANSYYSQPNKAPLFEQGQVNGTLDYAEVPSANLIALKDTKKNKYFPIATSSKSTPVLGLLKPGDNGSYTQQNISTFENEVLNPSRKKTISNAHKEYKSNLVKPQASEDVDDCPIQNLTTTPQGFLVNLNSDKTEWKCLTLANNEETTNKISDYRSINNQEKQRLPQGSVSPPPPLRFKEINTETDTTGLQNAFQTNEQFLVISNPTNLDYYKNNFQDKIAIADWPFILNIAQEKTDSNTSEEFTNIMIFKFCSKSIEDRIADSTLWTDPTTFNTKNTIPQLIKWIQDYIETARKSISFVSNNKSENTASSIQAQGFQQFIDIIEDPNWHGVISLQVTLDLESLPSEIKAILAGIDTSRFAAHHLGIEANQIKTNENNQLDTDFKSSLFGMISYFNTTYLDYQTGKVKRPIVYPPAQGTYDFQVLDLQVLFKNSLISDFNSKIQLNMNSVFDEIVIGESAPGNGAIYKNSILMNGQYDKKNGSTSYTFSVANPNTLTLSSTALDDVTITGIEMSTIDDTIKDGHEQITTRFTISGNLKFQKIDEFDLFSYNSLIFSNLILDMEFNLGVIGADHTPKKVFTFSPSDVVFNRSSSIPRTGSLVPHFPIELDNLLYNNPANTPDNKPITTSSLGYMQVEAPLPTAPVGNTWYALRFNLNMGSIGALASKVGFNSEVILAWSPGKNNNQAQIYAKMPFSRGIAGTNFSIEGVLKFAIGSILFFNDPSINQYSMIFTEVGVSLLGKKLPPYNPSSVDSGKSNLGWFGAYKTNKPKKKSQEKITV
jgi:hypothetical protein